MSKKNVYEIGVGLLSSSRTREFWGNDMYSCFLYEPNPILFNEIYQYTKFFRNVNVFNYAISDSNDDSITMVLHGDCSFIDGVKSPIVAHGTDHLARKPENYQKVKNKRITDIDKGDIDILLLDMEGGEWAAIKNLISRPHQIVVEMIAGDYYVNPNKELIMKWMDENGYKKHSTNYGDYIFVK